MQDQYRQPDDHNTINSAEMNHDSQDRYRASFEFAPIGLAHVAPDGSWLAVNQRFSEMLGYSRGELLSHRFQDLTYAEDLLQDIEYLQRMLAGDIERYAMEKRYVRKDGELLWAYVTASLIRNEATGEPLHFVAAVEDISKRKQMEHDLLDSTERLRLAVEGAEIGTWHWDIVRNDLVWSEKTRLLLGLPDVDVPTYDLFMQAIHPDDREATNQAVAASVENKAAYDVEYRAIWPDGSLHWHISRGRCFYDDNGAAFWMEGILIDITERRLAEDELRRSKEDLQFAVSAARLGTFYCDWPLDKIIWNTTCKEHFFLAPDEDVDFALFYSLLHPDDRKPTRLAIERAAAEHVEYDVEYRTMSPEGQTRWVNAVGRFYYDAHGTPVRFDGITIDISARKNADLAAAARAKQEMLLGQIARAERASLDAEEIQSVAINALAELLQVDRCYFNMIDIPNDLSWIGRDYHRHDLHSLAGEYRISDYKIDPERYYPDGGTLVIEDVDQGPFLGPFLAVLKQLRVQSAMAVPLFNEGRLVATLTLAMADKPRRWTPEEIALVEDVATQTRSSVESARLISEKQARLEREALINGIGVSIRNSQDPESIKSAAVNLLGEALGADRCYFAMYDLARGVVTVSVDWRRPDLPSIQGVHPFTNTVDMFNELYKDSTTSVIVDAYTARLSEQTIANMESLQLRSRMSVALVENKQLMATLTAAMSDVPRDWTSEEIALIEAVATQLRTAVELAQVQQREHRIATELQDALQPAMPEHVRTLRIARFSKPALDEAAIGGDFYDVFPLNNAQYALIVGDVSGKGLAAAAQLATVRNMLRGFLYQYGEPAEAVSNLNHILTSHNLLMGFVTVFIGVYDIGDGRITYVSCGHEPGLIRRAATNTVDQLETTGPPLGVADYATYYQLTVGLSEGDALLLYTDGISEAGLSRRNLLGTDGLIRIFLSSPADLSVDMAASQIIDDVSSYTNHVFRDDVCLLLARRELQPADA